MITLQELDDYLRDYLDTVSFADFGPNGIQVEGRSELRRIVTSVSASLEAIEGAVAQEADALIVHHGLFWNKQTARVVSALRRKLRLLLAHEISLLAYHLPLDAHREVGNNWVAARALGMEELEPAVALNGISYGVQGRVGMPCKAWVARLEQFYGQKARAALGGPEIVERAVLISGGAHNEIRQAVTLGVDCFITGSGDEPIWWIAMEEGLHFISMGHSATERIGPRALGEHLAARFGLKHQFLADGNPF